MTDSIKSTGVIGLGVMGFDIAFLYAQKGYRTLVYDAAEAAMNNLAARRDQTIERLKRRNRITEAEAENVRNRLVTAPGLDGLGKADLITEAVSESGKTNASQSGRRRRLHERAICDHALFQSRALYANGRGCKGRHERHELRRSDDVPR